MCENQQEQIVKRAAEQFKQFGIRSVSIDDLCRDMNMSKKTFYVYFRQKDDLVQAVLDYVDAQISAVMLSQFGGKTATQAVKLLLACLREVKEMRHQPPFQYDLQKYYPEIKQRHDQKIYDIVYQYILKHLNKGIDEGIYRSDIDKEACAAYITLVHRQWMSDVFDVKQVSQKRMLNFFVDSFFRTILTDESKYLINNIKGI